MTAFDATQPISPMSEAAGREDVEGLAESLWLVEKAGTEWPGNYPDRWQDEPLRHVYRRTASLFLASPWLAAYVAAAVETARRAWEQEESE